MKRIGILHISDVHITAESIPRIDELVSKLIKDIIKVILETNMKINLICFVGDLIDRGDKAFEDEMQIQLAEEHFINPLLLATGLTSQDFILVPGNHEVDKQKIVKMTEKGLSGISSLEEINDTIFHMADEYNQRLSNFYNYMFKNYLTDAKRWSLGYSIERSINEINVGIVGIDSAWRSNGEGHTERGNMLVGEHQVGVLYNNISDADLKICLMHHPLDWLSDLEMNNVEKRLNYFDLVLRGHVHDLDNKQICTQKYKTIYNTSGKIYPIDNYYSGYSLIDIDMELNKCYIYLREYLSSPRDDFDEALRIHEGGKAEYCLMAYDEAKVLEFDLKLRLREYFEKVTEKYAMLRNVDSFSPKKIIDFYVEPTIYEKPAYERSEISTKEDEKEQPIPLYDLMTSMDNIMLIGKRECGKTTVLQQFGIKHTEAESKHIPVFIDMLNMTKGKDRVLNACMSFIFSNLSDGVALTKEQVFHLLSNGKLLCLIDNVNISCADHIIWLQNFIKEYPNNRFVFSVEEKFYQTYSIKDLPDIGINYKTVYIEYFGKKQVREMVTKWGEGKDGFDANEMTQKIVAYCNNVHFAMTPYNVAVFMTIWDIDRSFVPINEGKVMRTYLETVLDKFSAEDYQRSEYDFDIKQHFLGYLAFKMYQKDEYYFSTAEFNKIVDEYHEKKGFKKTRTKFDIIFFEKNILYISGENVFFCNTSILEYCLAYYATIDADLYKYMTSKGSRGNFVHEITFYSGIVNDCKQLLDNLYEEITETILENMDILDEIEKLKIKMEFQVDKHSFQESLTQNRGSMNEIDDEVAITREDHNPMEIKKINSVDDSESFLDLLNIYGNVVKNAETADAIQKKIHLDTYMLGMNFQFGLIVRDFSAFLISKTKEELPKEILEKHPNLTDEEYEEIKDSVMDLLKIAIPIGMQLDIAKNVGTPKLDMIIDELIKENSNKKFTRFMLSFLYCDIGNGGMKRFIMNYIKEEDSKDILKMILFKLIYYYRMRYFGNNLQMDNMLLDLITEVEIKISTDKKLMAQIKKGEIKQQIKQQYETKRKEFI